MMSQAQGQHRDLIQSIEGLPAAPGLSPLDQDLLMLKATSMATMNCLNECLHILHLQQVARQRGSLGGGSRDERFPAALCLFACPWVVPTLHKYTLVCLSPTNRSHEGPAGCLPVCLTVELFCIIDREPYLFLPPVSQVIRSQTVEISQSISETLRGQIVAPNLLQL